MSNTIPYVVALEVLLFLFGFRVVAQLLQVFYLVSILPPFESWHSGAMPYAALVASQVLIIVVFGRVVWRLSNGIVRPNSRWGKAMLVLGGLYFSTMVSRLIAGITFAVDHSWFGAIIPTIFHMVLASFILIYGHYHYKYGGKTHG